ncbi:MAG: hypothetical protein ABIV07_10050 [Polaromonas sp.]
MKTLLLVLTAAGLSGCAVYPAPAYEVYGGAGPPYVVDQPVYIQGGASYAPYGYGAYPQPYVYPRYYHPGYRALPRAAPPRHGARPNAHPVRPGRGVHDRDGDGVRNRHDRRPNDPVRR